MSVLLLLANPPSATPLPVVIVDCTTSQASAERLYELGAPIYRWFGQSTDPDSLKSGVIDLRRLVEEVDRRMGPKPSGWGMLDYEEPFDRWLDLPKSDAKHQQAVSEMLKAIRAVKRFYPNVKWTFYGQPRLERWLPTADGTTRGWSLSTQEAKDREITRRIDSLSELIAEVDWINPSFYDVYENSMFAGPERDVMLANEEQWRVADGKLGRTIRAQLGLPQVPVMPCVSPLFQPGGGATAQLPIPIGEFLTDQVMPTIRAGCDGVTMWSGADFVLNVATMMETSSLDAEDLKLRADARKAWIPLAPGGKVPHDWSDPGVKFSISQQLGDAIVTATRATQAEFRKVKVLPLAGPAPQGAGAPSGPSVRPLDSEESKP
jgi:hypothetical protein